MNTKSIFSVFMVLALAFIINACGRGTIYKEYREMENYTWNRFDVLEFDVPIENAGTGYDMILAIRHIEQIPYEVLKVNFTFYTPSGEMRSLDYDLKIKDHEGNLLGEGMGDLWDLEVPMREDFRFSEEGVCRFEIHNRMPRVKTIGVMDVGLIIRKHRE